MVSELEKPPIGLMPESIYQHHCMRNRLIEIAEAMTRYAKAGKPIPEKWCYELERRISDYVPKPFDENTSKYRDALLEIKRQLDDSCGRSTYNAYSVIKAALDA